MAQEVITEFKTGERLDKVLAGHFPEYSRSALAKLIERGSILVNNQVKPARYKLKIKDQITIDLGALQRPTSSIQLPIIYEDDDVVVINKPSGVLAHSKGTFNKEGTVATWLKDHTQTTNVVIPAKAGIQPKLLDPRVKPEDDNTAHFWESNRAGIVHRLDRPTSGVMVCAKNEAAQKFLQKQFSNRTVKKTYLAIITGKLPEESGLIDIPIERNPKKPATFRAGINGKPAQTAFKVVKSDASHTMVELQPLTGRTHQLRIHLQQLKHPIVGDEIYGGEKADRLLLHAQALELTLPGGTRRIFKAPVPAEMKGSVTS